MRINQIHTPCKDCVFAVYEGVTQTGCSVGMLEKFRSKGCEILEVYDEQKEFYVINDVRCFAARSKKWADKQAGDLKDAMQAELKIPYQAIVFEQGHVKPTIKTIKSLVNQTLPPAHITIINKAGPVFAREFLDFLKTQKVAEWKIQNVTNPKATEYDYVDQIVAFRKEAYIGIFYAGCEVPKDTFETINRSIFEDMAVFTYIEPNSSGSGKIIPYTIYVKAKAGNVNLEDIPGKQTLKITELCQNFPK